MDEATAFRCDVDVWAATLRHALDTLLSLSRPYAVRFALPAPRANTRLVRVLDLGFDVTSVLNAHLLQVSDLADSAMVQSQFVPSSTQNNPQLRIDAIVKEDYLVGMNLVDFRVAPRSLAHFRKELQYEQEQASEGTMREITLHFLRLDRLVLVDPSLNRTHGSVLETLTSVDRMRERLEKQYDLLQDLNYQYVTHKLRAEMKLMAYIRIISHEIRSTLMENDHYQFAHKFRSWFEEINNSCEAEAIKQKLFASNEAIQARGTTEQPNGGVDLTTRTRGQVNPLEPPPRRSSWVITRQKQRQTPFAEQPKQVVTLPATSKPSLPRRIVDDRDLRWIDFIPPADIKWLSNAKTALRTFQQGVMDCFMVDGEDDSRISQVSREITQQLARVYMNKRHITYIDNSTLHKEFARHTRMLRSNLKIPDNKPLRSDLMSGAISMAQLCEMSSAELAPEALRLERQRRFELHARSNTIIEPTGPALVKTKNGLKEVMLGGVNEGDENVMETTASIIDGVSRSVDTSLQEPSLIVNSDEADEGEDMDISPPEETTSVGVSTSTEPKADEVVVVSNVAITLQEPKTRKKVSFANNLTSVREIESRHDSGIIGESSRNEHDSVISIQTLPSKPPAPTQPYRPVSSHDGRTFLQVLFSPNNDLLGLVAQFNDMLRYVPMSTLSREFILAPGVMVSFLCCGFSEVDMINIYGFNVFFV